MRAFYWIILGIVVGLFGGSISGYIGWIGLAIIIYGIYRAISEGSSKKKVEKNNDVGSGERVYQYGTVTVYPDSGYFMSGRKQIRIDEVTNVSFYQKSSGFLGGGIARIDIMTNNFDNPMIRTRIFAPTGKGLKQKYQRLALLLNATDMKYSIEY